MPAIQAIAIQQPQQQHIVVVSSGSTHSIFAGTFSDYTLYEAALLELRTALTRLYSWLYLGKCMCCFVFGLEKSPVVVAHSFIKCGVPRQCSAVGATCAPCACGAEASVSVCRWNMCVFGAFFYSYISGLKIKSMYGYVCACGAHTHCDYRAQHELKLDFMYEWKIDEQDRWTHTHTHTLPYTIILLLHQNCLCLPPDAMHWTQFDLISPLYFCTSCDPFNWICDIRQTHFFTYTRKAHV